MTCNRCDVICILCVHVKINKCSFDPFLCLVLVTEFDCPKATPCSQQDVKTELLTNPSQLWPQQEPQYSQDEGVVGKAAGDKQQGPQPSILQPPPQGKPSYSPQAPPRPVLRSSQQIRGPPGRGPVPSPPNTDPQRPHMIRQQQPLPPQPSHKEAAHVSGGGVPVTFLCVCAARGCGKTLSWSKGW